MVLFPIFPHLQFSPVTQSCWTPEDAPQLIQIFYNGLWECGKDEADQEQKYPFHEDAK